MENLKSKISILKENYDLILKQIRETYRDDNLDINERWKIFNEIEGYYNFVLNNSFPINSYISICIDDYLAERYRHESISFDSILDYFSNYIKKSKPRLDNSDIDILTEKYLKYVKKYILHNIPYKGFIYDW